MPPSRPGPNDYVIELRSVLGHGAEPIWVISRHEDLPHFFPDRALAIRVVLELARFGHCHAWLVAEDAEPTLLTESDASASSVS